MRSTIAFFLLLWSVTMGAHAADQVPLQVEKASPGAPLTVGIPFPQGALYSPDHVRVLNARGEEIPAQITEVTTWLPADSSIKWIWAFFFADDSPSYVLEYGPEVRRAPITGDEISLVNNQRPYGGIEVTTGPLRISADRGGSAFLDQVELDLEGDGFEEDDVIAVGAEARGSFLDLLDDAGTDSSRAVITHTVTEKGSGPLHAIVRIEGLYYYGREDNNPSPFVTRIHAYAGKSFIRVFHTITYTGVPDKHTPQEGEYGLIATHDGKIVDEEAFKNDEGWMQPNDRIQAAGLALEYRLGAQRTQLTPYRNGAWWNPGEAQYHAADVAGRDELYVLQSGPDVTRKPPVASSTPTERIDGFSTQIVADGAIEQEATRAIGWSNVSDGQRGVTVGIRHFFEEYPKEIYHDVADGQIVAYLWSPHVAPMDFSRASLEQDSQMLANFAQGVTKTTELVFHFHGAAEDRAALARTMNYFLDPPAPHAEPSWYAASKVYGSMAPRSERFAEYERGIDYKLAWWQFNQDWEPWYGMFDFGDGKTYYHNGEWVMFNNNEPATDLMWWLAFMRTGNRDYYLTAEAASRHTMDVDNVHWPTGPVYRGDTNASLDYWRSEKEPQGTPYLGMGRRHASQHWSALLSAHVWVPGWVASYYLTGYHRGLEIAELTADYYVRRVFGEHGLTGRRLYLSVWNLVEVYDATKNDRYRAELDDRVDRMLRLQGTTDQGGSLAIERYGYAHVYVTQGLSKYYQITGDPRVRSALIRHARVVRDVAPLNHDMESYLASISSLLQGYELSRERSFLTEAIERAQVLKTDRLAVPFEQVETQGRLAELLEEASNLPDRPGARRPAIWKITNGLRVFGWTHAYNVPYLVYWLEEAGSEEVASKP